MTTNLDPKLQRRRQRWQRPGERLPPARPGLRGCGAAPSDPRDARASAGPAGGEAATSALTAPPRRTCGDSEPARPPAPRGSTCSSLIFCFSFLNMVAGGRRGCRPGGEGRPGGGGTDPRPARPRSRRRSALAAPSAGHRQRGRCACAANVELSAPARTVRGEAQTSSRNARRCSSHSAGKGPG